MWLELLEFEIKTSTSFELKAANSEFSTSVTGNTVVDYVVMEAGTYTIDDGSSTGRQVIADTEVSVSGVFCSASTYEGSTATVSWSGFTGNPAVLHTISSDNDTDWTTSATDNGAQATPPDGSGARFYQMRGDDAVADDCDHDPEDIDYMAFQVGFGTTTAGNFDALVSGDDVEGSGVAYAVPFNDTFPAVPETVLVAMVAIDGGDGGAAYIDTDTAIDTSNAYASIDELGNAADRGTYN